jgi:hypothetical protein
MNKKFIKENKKLVREFLSNLIVKLLTGKATRDVQQKIDADPTIQRHRVNIQKIEKQIIRKIEKKKQSDPDFAKKLNTLARRYA